MAPLPPHISLEEAKNFLASILKGDAQTLGFLKQIAKDVAAGHMPREEIARLAEAPWREGGAT